MRLLPLPRPFETRISGRLAVALVVALGFGSESCSNKPYFLKRDEISKQLDVARYQSAQRCAPQDLAVAEANYRFAEVEYDQGNFSRAEEHVTLADAAVQRAVKTSAPCAPDTDKDGLTDNVDKCPKVPGPKENNGCPWPDTDKDGLTDNVDKCPTVAGPKENNGCPWPDTDKDGITDNLDKCPNDPEDYDGYVDEDGCPEPDNDNDGVLDIVDRCPMEPGPVANQGCPVMDRDADGIMDDVDKCPDDPGIPEYEGCPPSDRDGDGVPDHIDKCPDEPGLIELQGCPKKYSLVVLKKDSFKLLTEIAGLLKDNPKLRVHIDGHTDSKSDEKRNLVLSQKRAESVRTFLVKAGIAVDRLVPQGFGESVPIASNRTEVGRAQNRRVEFNIIDAAAPKP
jgi:OOP family OmpA-OmpF porin